MRIFSKMGMWGTDCASANSASATSKPEPISRKPSSANEAVQRVKRAVSRPGSPEKIKRMYSMKAGVQRRLSIKQSGIKKTFSKKHQPVVSALRSGRPAAARYALAREGIDPNRIDNAADAQAVVTAISQAPQGHNLLFGMFHGSRFVRAAFDGDALAQEKVDAHQPVDGFLLGKSGYGVK